jgi:hypothetical protein
MGHDFLGSLEIALIADVPQGVLHSLVHEIWIEPIRLGDVPISCGSPTSGVASVQTPCHV